MKVMVVEDSRAIRERLTAMIEDIAGKGSVIEAGCVSEAIKKIAEYKPEVILLDLLLPDGHGLDVLLMIKAYQQSPKVIMMTNDPNERYKKLALQLGASYFFDKVKDFDKVFETIKDMVNRR